VPHAPAAGDDVDFQHSPAARDFGHSGEPPSGPAPD
jgi:hypothetical protein